MGTPAATEDWPLTGRDRVLADIGAALEGGGAVLSGRFGVGRTRLAREAVALARDRGWAAEWVAATRAAASVPFGAVSHLVAGVPGGGPEPLAFLLAATGTLAARAAAAPGGRLLLAVDDAHLLDDGSATLVHQLAARSVAVVLATVRDGYPAPDAVTALWKDGPARLLRVPPLSDPALDRLMRQALGAPVDEASRAELLRVAAGSPLVLQLLLADALADRSLARERHAWTWHRERYQGQGLARWAGDLLAPLPGPVRTVVEVICCGEPLPLTALDRLVGMAALEPDAVDAAERSGLIVHERSGPEATLRPGHPGYGEAVRARLPLVRARRVREWLARAGLGVGAPAGVVAGLTHREREIALLAASGLPSKLIAERLWLSVRTVNNHLAHVYTKLHVTSRGQLATLVFPAGASPDESSPVS